MNDYPKVAVLLAAFNAKKWLLPQLETILAQKEVTVTLFISLDCSSDGSYEWLVNLLNDHLYDNVTLLPYGERFGSAAKNFYHLIKMVDCTPFDYVAFADQDDLWNKDKLQRAISSLNQFNAGGYSNNVTAFWEDGRTKTLKKDYKQTPFDYFFESAGPGCSYVIRAKEAVKLQKLVADHYEKIQYIEFHDWLIYAFIRDQNKLWIIDQYEGMRYRQHGSNVIGARSGLAALKRRFAQIRNGWYRTQVLYIFKVLGEEHHKLYQLIKKNTFTARLQLMPFAFRFRRKKTDGLILMTMLLLNLW